MYTKWPASAEICTLPSHSIITARRSRCHSDTSAGCHQHSNTDQRLVRGVPSGVSSSSSGSFPSASWHSAGRPACPPYRCSCPNLGGTRSVPRPGCRAVDRRSPSTVAGTRRAFHRSAHPRSHTVRKLPGGSIRRVSLGSSSFCPSVPHRRRRCPCLFYKCSRCFAGRSRRTTRLDLLVVDLCTANWSIINNNKC